MKRLANSPERLPRHACRGLALFLVGIGSAGAPALAGPGAGTEINAVNTPGDADSVFRITQPGPYYLAANMTGVAGKRGIEIAAGGVTIDLGGFEVAGVLQSLDGIGVDPTAPSLGDVVVRHGLVREWTQDGVDLGLASRTIVEGLIIRSSGQRGLVVNADSLVRGCIVTFSGTSGIHAAGGRTIITECVTSVNKDDGILAPANCTVTRCVSNLNFGDGISVIGNCVLRENMCSDNGNQGDGAGIHVTGIRNLIESNVCYGGDRGIQVSQINNTILRNVVRGSGTNYVIVANNFLATVVTSQTALNEAGNANVNISGP